MNFNMAGETDLSETEIERLDTALQRLREINPNPDADKRMRDLRALVLDPTLEEWDRLYRTALDERQTLSLWQAVSLTSSFPSVVPIDDYGRCYWNDTPDSEMLLQALEYALS